MLVSWNWLKEYVDLPAVPDDVTRRLMMAGLNHESSEKVGSDLAIDLEVTSNRADCLGHIGIAREIAVLLESALRIPAARPRESQTAAASLTRVDIECPELCYQYTARVIRGVRIGPSPNWMADRLRAIGITPINNVVDATNYVMLECGQPLHAFDFARLGGRRIVVREARPNEQFLAIDHKTYALERGMCVIADTDRAVALGGVMGGAESEVSDRTTEVLVESAEFAPLSIRNTARKLLLHSPSSYRFERGVDAAGVDWASRRCCELILQTAGGELASGVVVAGSQRSAREPVTLRLSQLKRVLGIEVPAPSVQRILSALCGAAAEVVGESVRVVPPSWRRDLSREIDLIEEVARIYGYDAIPEDVQVPMAASFRTIHDRVLEKARQVLTAAGFDEAITNSMVTRDTSESFSPWTEAPAITSATPILKGADQLRRSLVPSLLGARQHNESLQNPSADLFETAKIYLPQAGGGLPIEQWTLSLVGSADFFKIRGVVEALAASLHLTMPLNSEPVSIRLLDPSRSCKLTLGDEAFGYVGQLTPEAVKQFGLRSPTGIAELSLGLLEKQAQLVPQHSVTSTQPPISRDLNLVMDEAISWSDLSATVRRAGGTLLESLEYRETYRDPGKDGPGKKRVLLTVVLRALDRTLTNEEADQLRQTIVNAAAREHQAALLG